MNKERTNEKEETAYHDSKHPLSGGAGLRSGALGGGGGSIGELQWWTIFPASDSTLCPRKVVGVYIGLTCIDVMQYPFFKS